MSQTPASRRRRSHAGPPATPGPRLPEPSFAERVRTLLAAQAVGTLATHSSHREGYPFASVMPFALDAGGDPLFLISAMAMHTQNLRRAPRASLLVAEDAVGRDPLGAARATLLGTASKVLPEEASGVRGSYLEAHPSAAYWVEFKDFAFYRLTVESVYYVGGFGVMGWVEADDYAGARADPLAPAAAGIVTHMNDDHADALVLLARHGTDLEPVDEARMTSIDRLGFRLKARSGERWQSRRLAFPESVETPGKAREVLVSMVGEARAALVPDPA